MRKLLLKVVGQALRSPRNNKGVHAIEPPTDDAAKPSRAELQVPVETILELFPVLFLKESLHLVGEERVRLMSNIVLCPRNDFFTIHTLSSRSILGFSLKHE